MIKQLNKKRKKRRDSQNSFPKHNITENIVDTIGNKTMENIVAATINNIIKTMMINPMINLKLNVFIV